MNREEIISKGFYTYPQHKDYVCVKQYIVLKDADKKYLALRMVNNHSETATGLILYVRQYDAEAKFISSERLEIEGISEKPDSVFSLGQKVALHKDCADFEIDVVCMTFGVYKYIVKQGEVIPVFSLDDGKSEQPDKAELIYKMRKSKQTVSRRTRVSPKLFAVLASIIFIVVSAFSALQILNFAKTERVFTLDDIEYSFETDNHVDGPICIDRYKSIVGNIIIPEQIEGYKVARIAEKAFSGSLIGSVVIEGDTVIENNAFEKCWFLKSVTLGKVSSAGDNAFYACSNLEAVTINDSLVSIGDSAFAKCSALKEINLPDTLEQIKAHAFMGCSSLEEIVVPDRLLSMGEGVFAGCSKLKTLSVPFLGPDIGSSKSISYLFVSEEKTYPPTKATLSLTVGQMDQILSDTFAGCTYIEKLDFKKDVVAISDKAFSGCKNLTWVDMSDSLASLGEAAFENCGALKSVYLSDNVKDIKPYTFSKCSSLVDIRISNKLVTVGEYAFEDCIALTVLKFPATVGTIDAAAFKGCSSIKELAVPFLGVNESTPSGVSTWFTSSCKSLEKITVLRCNVVPEQAFKDCTALKEVTLPALVNGIGKQAFLNCSALKSFDFPIGVSVIDEQAFKGCTALEKIELSNKVTKIGSRAFENCVSLSNAELSDVIRTVESYAFAGCTALESFKIPANVKNVSEGMLFGCTELKDVTLPVILETVDARAFFGCYNLAEISLPDSVVSLGSEAFRGCSSIETIEVPDGVEAMGASIFAECTSLASLKLPDLKKNEAEYGSLEYFFEGLEGEDESSVPQSLKAIELTNVQFLQPYAFSNCSSIESITLPVSLDTVGAYAFNNCSSLKNLIIPIYTGNIGQHAFNGCTSMEELSVPSIPEGTATAGGLEFLFGEVPKALERVRITNSNVIPRYSFAECVYVKEIIFDSDVNIIQPYAFYNCTRLGKITLPATLVGVGANAFEGCYRLYEVINDSSLQFAKDDATFLGKYAISIHKSNESARKSYVNDFEFLCYEEEKNGVEIEEWYLIGYVGEKTEWQLPNGVEFGEYRIANYAFYNNEDVESVYIPWNVGILGESMFAHCYSLKNVRFDKNTTATFIPVRAFESCVALERVDLPSVVNSVEDYAFMDCSGLLQISLPTGFNRIGVDAFVGCVGMMEVVNNGALTIQAGSNAYGEIAKYALQVVSTGTLSNITTVTVDGVDFRFAKVSGVWYLYRIDTNGSEVEIIDLTRIDLVEKEGYAIIKRALDIDGVSRFVIPTGIRRVSDESLYVLASQTTTVYYMGDANSWNKLVSGNATVYYYAKCIHMDGQWNYDSDGKIVTRVNATQTKELSKATCTKEGEKQVSCAVCKAILYKEPIPVIEHSYSNGVCTACGHSDEN